MFTQQVSYLASESLTDIIKKIKEKLKPKKLAGIIHDKDLDENSQLVKPHVHIVLQFESARSLNNLAKLLDQPIQCFEAWRGSVNNAYSYLVHHTKSASNKHIYDPKEVIADFDYIELLEKIRQNVTKQSKINDSVIINNLLDLLYEGTIDKQEIEQKLSGSQYAKAKAKIEAVHLKQLENRAREWQKEMREKNEKAIVIWLFGKAGTGKTRLARHYAKQFNEIYFITGSIRDPFQSYQMEPVVILDELRPHQFDYTDLLKLFDPYNEQVMASSRYFDKPIMANIYIITSPYSPYDFFLELRKSRHINAQVDSYQQLMRRLTLVLEVSEQFIEMYNYDKHLGLFLKDGKQKLPNPYHKEESPDYNETEQFELFKDLTEKGIQDEKI
ncbi:TPA: replication protein [Streptococcus suis]|nr:replication protein [Streptococcus suis]HEM3627597.1 replication protein [Streptococcus suis]HEM3640715.1 replication protein [Streptococcus suis]HEM3653752.1 replication protein [Streptococcus suis]HEM3716106.1 replication protein [Streptococcus suis]